MTAFDRIIVSTNEDPLYLDFWPIAAWMWNALFPEARVCCAFVTERWENDPLVAEMRKYGEVTCYRPNDLPVANQTKMARYQLAMEEPETVSYIEDIDLLPLDREWILSKVSGRPKDHLLLVGAEIYAGYVDGQAPASQMTGEGKLFQQVLNPDRKPWPEWLDAFRGRTERHCDIASRAYHEDVTCPTSGPALGETLFSDEALLCRVRKEHPVPEHHVERGLDVEHDTLDRTWWPRLGEPLTIEGRVQSHCLRPFGENRARIYPMLEQFQLKHGLRPWPELQPRLPQRTPDMQTSGSGLMDEALEWIFDHIPAGSWILEFGSGAVSTNYLSRHYRLVCVESKREWLNRFPAYYIFGHDPESVRAGLESCPVPVEEFALCLIDGPTNGDTREPFVLPHHPPYLVDDTWREHEWSVARQLGFASNRAVKNFEQFSVV